MRDYKTTVRFTADELILLRKAAGDAPLTTFIRKGIIREAERKVQEEEKRFGIDYVGGTGGVRVLPSGGGSSGGSK